MLDVMLFPAHNAYVAQANKNRSRTRGIAEDVRIRLAYPDDLAVLGRLAALDSQRPLEGDVLIAEIDGVAVAALSVDSGRVVADPFVSTLPEVALLKLRASRATPTRSGRRLLRRHRPATAGA
jgi:hypothetical protein